jgi:hypothetical protein
MLLMSLFDIPAKRAAASMRGVFSPRTRPVQGRSLPCPKTRGGLVQLRAAFMTTYKAYFRTDAEWAFEADSPPHPRAEVIQRQAAGETLTAIAKSYAVHVSTISRL